MSSSVAELRTRHRLEMELPIVVRWREGGKKHVLAGTTRNVSPDGLFVVSNASPPERIIIRCSLVLPALQPERADTIYEAVMIGRVKRVEHAPEGQSGFAIQNRLMVLRSPER